MYALQHCSVKPAGIVVFCLEEPTMGWCMAFVFSLRSFLWPPFVRTQLSATVNCASLLPQSADIPSHRSQPLFEQKQRGSALSFRCLVL